MHTRRHTRFRTLALAMGLPLTIASLAEPLDGATRAYIGGGIPNCTNPVNWSGGVVPGEGDAVIIGTTTAQVFDVTAGTGSPPPLVGSITLDYSSDLTVASDMSVSGQTTVSGNATTSNWSILYLDMNNETELPPI